MGATPTPRPVRDARGSAQQLLLVGIAVVGLLAAGLALPGGGAPSGPPAALVPQFNETETPPDCTVTLNDRPVPGTTATVTVLSDHEPAEDVRVWFDDEYVGRTDERGRVSGEVPYRRTFRVRVGLAGNCDFSVDTLSDGTPADDDATTEDVGFSAGASALGASAGLDGNPAQTSRRNFTATAVVRERISVEVLGDPYPGETVTLVATLARRPVPDAAVRVDGTPSGATDGRGRFSLRVPDDGTERIRVRVTKGDFTRVRVVDVLLLRVAVQSESFPARPGGPAVATVQRADEPVADAPVAVDGRTVGRTDGEGRVDFALPGDPTATVSTSARDQRATAPVWPVYVPGVVAALLLLAVLIGVPVAAYRSGGRRALGWLGGAVGAAAVLGATYYVAGPRATLYAALGMAALALVVGLVVRNGTVSTSSFDPRGWLDGLGEAVVARLLGLTDALAALVDRTKAGLRRLWASIRNPDLSVAGLRAALLGALARARWTLRAAVGFLLGLPGRLRRGEADGDEDETGPAVGEPEDAPDRVSALRRTWRRFAREVHPGEWRRRTPGEVSRTALAAGYPDDPVRSLTEAFRTAEYTPRRLGDERAERAVAAGRRLLDATRESGSDPGGAGTGSHDDEDEGDREGPDEDHGENAVGTEEGVREENDGVGETAGPDGGPGEGRR